MKMERFPKHVWFRFADESGAQFFHCTQCGIVKRESSVEGLKFLCRDGNWRTKQPPCLQMVPE
jgi:hypothetical protein